MSKLPALDQHPLSAHSHNASSPAVLISASSDLWKQVYFLQRPTPYLVSPQQEMFVHWHLTICWSFPFSMCPSFTRSLTRSLALSLTRSLTHALTHSVAHSLTHSLTHSLILHSRSPHLARDPLGLGMHSQCLFTDGQGPRTPSSSKLAYPLSTHIHSVYIFTIVHLIAYNYPGRCTDQ